MGAAEGAGTVAGVAAPAWFDELALPAEGPPWLSMGLARGDDAGWLTVDERRDEELAERHRLLAERHDEVFAALPGTEAAGAETLALVSEWLAEHRPDLASIAPPGGLHPLEAAGRLVQEDLCLMVERGGRYHLDAACLCFPSHWRLADKLGHRAADIHGPVPHYADELAEKVDRYLARLRPGVIGVRRNWTVHDSPALFAPDRPTTTPIGVVDVPTALWLRSERQTLRRLPGSGAVLFTIRVQQAPFAALAERPAVAARLAARIEAQPPELTEMNGLAAHRDQVVGWLGLVAGPT